MSFKEFGQKILYGMFDPLVWIIRKFGLTPNNITTIGFLINIIAGIYLVAPFFLDTAISVKRLVGFGIIVLFSGLMDVLDGRMARVFQLKSTYGAFYDSVMDRYSELIMFLGLIAYFIIENKWVLIFIVFCCLSGSLMVSYTRARAEGLNVKCSVGLLQRPERILLITLSCIVAGIIGGAQSDIVLIIGLGIVAILANFTAFQRIAHAKKQMNQLPH